MWQRLLSIFERVGAQAGDPPDLQLKKRLLVALSFLMGVAAPLWGALYFALDEPLAAAIPWTYTAASAISLVVFAISRRYHIFRISQLSLILVLPFLLQLVLGGFVNASAVIIWALLAPLGAMVISGRRQAVWWFAAYIAVVVLAQVIQPSVQLDNNLTRQAIISFFIMNLLGPSAVAFVVLHYFVGQKDKTLGLLEREQEKSERLLLNVLPRDIAAALKDEEQTIADHFPHVSVLFADIVGFTPLSAALEPDELVDLLNSIFSHFDALVERYGCEKIRTIGDNYMVASGLPDPRPDHAHALASMALDISAYIRGRPPYRNHRVDFRIGLNSGPVIAGVIGHRKYQYDLWGDTVNTASRMESGGTPGKIQITRETYELICDDFDCEPRGKVMVKGKGELETWYLVGHRPAAPAPSAAPP